MTNQKLVKNILGLMSTSPYLALIKTLTRYVNIVLLTGLCCIYYCFMIFLTVDRMAKILLCLILGFRV